MDSILDFDVFYNVVGVTEFSSRLREVRITQKITILFLSSHSVFNNDSRSSRTTVKNSQLWLRLNCLIYSNNNIY